MTARRVVRFLARRAAQGFAGGLILAVVVGAIAASEYERREAGR